MEELSLDLAKIVIFRIRQLFFESTWNDLVLL
jgi:hypothetical protein